VAPTSTAALPQSNELDRQVALLRGKLSGICLDQYVEPLLGHGFDYVDDFYTMTADELRNTAAAVSMLPGHARRFVNLFSGDRLAAATAAAAAAAARHCQAAAPLAAAEETALPPCVVSKGALLSAASSRPSQRTAAWSRVATMAMVRAVGDELHTRRMKISQAKAAVTAVCHTRSSGASSAANGCDRVHTPPRRSNARPKWRTKSCASWVGTFTRRRVSRSGQTRTRTAKQRRQECESSTDIRTSAVARRPSA